MGVGRSAESLQQALSLGVIDQAESDVKSAIQDADAIIIATPVAQTPSILAAIKPHLAVHTILSDAGSTKGDVVQYVGANLRRQSTPICACPPHCRGRKKRRHCGKSGFIPTQKM